MVDDEEPWLSSTEDNKWWLQSWLAVGNIPENILPASFSCEIPEVPKRYRNTWDIDMLRDLQSKNLTLVDSREYNRYLGLEEPIDPVAGHIPGALNRPWVSVTDDCEKLLSNDIQRQHWGDVLESEKIVVYCGSGVTACVNLFSLHVWVEMMLFYIQGVGVIGALISSCFLFLAISASSKHVLE